MNLDILDINCDLTEQKELKSSFLLIISTYNYISSSWEPFIENTPIKVLIYKKEENNLKIISFNMEILKYDLIGLNLPFHIWLG